MRPSNSDGSPLEGSDKFDVSRYPEMLVLQVQAMGFPAKLIPNLHNKISDSVFDAAEGQGFKVESKKAMFAESDVFLVDHSLEYAEPVDYDAEFGSHPELISRLASLLSVITPDIEPPQLSGIDLNHQEKNQSDEPVGSSPLIRLLRALGNPPLNEIDRMKIGNLLEQEITDDWLSSAPIGKLFPNIERLHLEQNLIESKETIRSLCLALPNLKAIHLTGNSICSQPSYSNDMKSVLPKSIEVLDGKLTENYTSWALEVANGSETPSVLRLGNADMSELRTNAFKSLNLENLHCIDLRGNPRMTAASWRPLADMVKQANAKVETVWIDDDRLLKDYAAVFSTSAKINNTPLWLCEEGVAVEDPQASELIKKKVIDKLPTTALKYQMAKPDSPEDRITVSYVLDELGSYIGHSARANFRLGMIFTSSGTISILWPVKNVLVDDAVTRDYAETITDPDDRKRRLDELGVSD
ncbi:hypothetical protein NDN08_001704 [Rhodosorus marinus]|uniref:Tubulin--tyrosine ligase-like protein 12 SET-like domain-containing protein n=1 Tax=Rhodosorus marinus TaxID=101924 RepID=A0AAV8URK0_9RHOD|nr:hypothetical protein NDN08_001704 [Rhodosorus marinus]